jgi:hypothetical protein
VEEKVESDDIKWGERKYPREMLEREIQKIQQKIDERRSYGELNHETLVDDRSDENTIEKPIEVVEGKVEETPFVETSIIVEEKPVEIKKVIEEDIEIPLVEIPIEEVVVKKKRQTKPKVVFGNPKNVKYSDDTKIVKSTEPAIVKQQETDSQKTSVRKMRLPGFKK